jgi:hypothetical protein
MSRIHLSKADVTAVEEQYILDAIRSGWVAPLGPDVDAFEAEIATRTGVSHVLALASGTAALHLGLLKLGAGPGTAVIVPTMTFAASANPIVYTGAEPVFVDSRADGNLDPELMMTAIDTLTAEGTRVVAAMSVDLFGRCADYDEIVPGLQERGIPLIEDAAEALGATYHGSPAGSFGEASVLSFNGNKIMTTSGGGMLLSNNGRGTAPVETHAFTARLRLQPLLRQRRVRAALRPRGDLAQRLSPARRRDRPCHQSAPHQSGRADMSEDSASRMTPLDRWLGATNFNEPPTLWTGVRTGLTDLSQVSRRYGLGWVNRFRLDIDCVNHHTFLGDRKFFVTRSPSS